MRVPFSIIYRCRRETDTAFSVKINKIFGFHLAQRSHRLFPHLRKFLATPKRAYYVYIGIGVYFGVPPFVDL